MATFGVVVFPGSNCDRDCQHALTHAVGVQVEMIWHKQTTLPKGLDGLILPGGFSYGDYLRAGAAAKFSPIMQSVVDFARSGAPVLGICNGFQILLEVGLLPGAMLRNDHLRFVCKSVYLSCQTARSAFSASLEPGQLSQVPIAHAQGNYTIDDDGLKRLQDREQIVWRYSDARGQIDEHSNPNGSRLNIAGICNEVGNVVGMMPHPERACEAILGSQDGLPILTSALSYLEE